MSRALADAPGARSGFSLVVGGFRQGLSRWLKAAISRSACGLLIVVASADALLRIAALSAGAFPLQFDSLGYWKLGTQVATGDLWMLDSASAYRPPLYPWLLGLFQATLGPWALAGVLIAQNVAGIATALLAARVAVALSGFAASAPLTYALLFLAPGRLPLDNMVMTESFFALLLVVHVLAVLIFFERPDWRSAGWAGATLGITLLQRTTVQYLWFVTLATFVFVALRRHEALPWRAVLKCAAFYCSAALLVLTPWIARNELTFGEAFVTRGLGIRLWAATFSERGAALELESEEAHARLAGADWRHEWGAWRRLDELGLNELEIDRFLIRESVRSIQADRGRFFSSAAGNWVGHFASNEEAIPWYYRVSSSGEYFAQRVPYSKSIYRAASPLLSPYFRYSRPLLLALGLAGLSAAALLVGLRPLRGGRLWFLLLLLYFPTVTALGVYPLYRFRAPTDPLLAAALGAVLPLLWWRIRSAKPPVSKPGTEAELT